MNKSDENRTAWPAPAAADMIVILCVEPSRIAGADDVIY